MEEMTFKGYGDLKLHGRIWPADSPFAVLLIVHGHGEHSGRYADMAAYLSGQRISVMSFDLRGHGLSEGKRGLVLDWNEFRQDAAAAAAELARRHPALPLFILGHSLGGTIALDLMQASDFQPRGAIISAPALGAPGISPILLTLAGLLSAVVPGLIMSTGLDSNAISSIPDECARYREDPLNHGLACVRLSTILKKTQNDIFRRAPDMICPVLLTWGTLDRIAPREPIESFFQVLGSGDKTMKFFDGAFHEIHNDTVRDDVYRLYAEWINRRI